MESAKNVAGLIPSGGARPAGNGGATASGAVEQCVNLRPATDAPGSLEPVGDLKKVSARANAHRVWPVTMPDGTEQLLLACGNELWVTAPAGEAKLLATLPSAITTTVVLGDGRAVVMAEGQSKPYFCCINADGNGWEWLGTMPSLDMPVVSAEAVGRLIHELPPRNLTGSYSTSNRVVNTADAQTLSADFRGAYEALHSQAAAAATFMQPVAVRVRAISRWGDTVALTPAVIITSPAGSDEPVNLQGCTRILTSTIESGYNHVQPTQVSCTTFRLRLHWPLLDTTAWNRWVERVEVEVTPQFHPLKHDGASECRFTQMSAAGAALQMSLPGLSANGAGVAYARMAAEGACAFDMLAQKAFTARPSAEGWVSQAPAVSFGYSSGLSAKEETKRVAAAIKSGSAADGPLAAAMHGGFTARCGVAVDDIVLWGNLECRPWSGASVLAWGVKFEEGIWQGQCHAEFACAAGTTRPPSLTRGCISSLKPLAVGPLLVWPDTRATELTLAVGDKRLRVPLVPSPDGRSAYWVNPSMKPLEVDADWETSTSVLPIAENPWTDSLASTIAMASAASPLEPPAWVTPTGAPVVTFAERGNSGAGLEFGRLHIYAFMRDAVASLSVDTSRRRLTSRRLSAGGVADDRLVAAGRGAVYSLSGGALTELSGNRTRTIAHSLPADIASLGFCGARNEVWAVRPGGKVSVYPLGGGCYERTRPEGIAMACNGGGRLWVATSDGVYLGDEESEAATPVSVRWSALLRLDRGKVPAALTWHLGATRVDGSLMARLRREAGYGDGRMLVRYSVHGALNDAVTARLTPLRGVPAIAMGFLGDVSADFRLRCAEMIIEQPTSCNKLI